MLRIMKKDVIVEKSELLYEADFSKQSQLENDFEIGAGKWYVEDGWLNGELEEDGGGLIYSFRHYKGDILIDFEGRTVPPYDNDLNFTFCAKGWDYEKNDADVSYIGGLQGWWLGKTGIEKYPECNLTAMTSMHDFESGKIYHVQTGRVQNRVFLFIDGVMAVEFTDDNPITDYGRVGFGVYACKAQFRNLKVYKPYSVDFNTSYQELREKNK